MHFICSLINCDFIFYRFEDEFFAYVTGDLLLLVFGGPAVFIYMVLSMGKFNMVENGVII